MTKNIKNILELMQCQGCYDFTTVPDGFCSCSLTCPGYEPGQGACWYYGPKWKVVTQYHPDKMPDPEGVPVIKKFLVCRCEYYDYSTCLPEVECPARLQPPYEEWEQRVEWPCVPCS